MFQSLRITSRFVAVTFTAVLMACLSLSATAAEPASRGDIVVVTVHGSASATMAGMTVPLSAGAILQLPATVRTGADGAVELRQGPSTFAAAGNTELEIPQSAAADGLIERIVQIRGNAFYSIGKRTGTRLRVEAPYLVAVIKGTQFNVAAQDDSTTIALFEGHLEVRASDESDVVNLEAGEIAIRHRNDVSISVLRLTAARGDARRTPPELAARQADSNSSTANAGAVTARNDGTASRPPVDATAAAERVVPSDGSNTTRTPSIDGQLDGGATVTAKAAIDVGSTESPVAARVDTSVAANVAGVGVDAGATTTVDVGAGSVAAAANVGVDVGSSVSADVGVGASVDVPAGTVAVDVGSAVAVGNVAAVDTSVAAAVDVPAGAVDVAAGTSVGVGTVAAVDVGAAAAVDVPAGTVNVGLDTSVASTDVGAAVGVDAGTGSVSADVGVGPVSVGPVSVGVGVGSGGIDLDLGLGADDSGDSGGLLGGLLHRRRN